VCGDARILRSADQRAGRRAPADRVGARNDAHHLLAAGHRLFRPGVRHPGRVPAVQAHRAKALSEYQDLIKNAFRELINLRILKRLDLPTNESEKPICHTRSRSSAAKVDERILTTAIEIAVFNWTKQRLAFLVRDEALFGEIEQLVVYYRRERKGRIYDFVEGDAPKYKFSFATDGEISTDRLSDIDKPLLAAFLKRVEEGGRMSKGAG
jgi:predicted type IV restriction endonuclease